MLATSAGWNGFLAEKLSRTRGKRHIRCLLWYRESGIEGQMVKQLWGQELGGEYMVSFKGLPA